MSLERIVLHSLEQLQLPSLLASLGLKPSYQKLALGLIATRMIAPDSERATFKWLENNSALKELLGISATDLKLERLYRVGDALYQHQSALESHLFQQTRDLLDLQSTIVLYDLSNTWFTTTKAGSESVQFG